MCCCQTPPVQIGTYCPGSGHGVYKRTSSDGTGSRRNTQAKAEIYAIMGDLAKKGYAIILISSEMPEILGMADRIVVMCNGRKTGELNRGEATQERILELAMEKGHTGGAK